MPISKYPNTKSDADSRPSVSASSQHFKASIRSNSIRLCLLEQTREKVLYTRACVTAGIQRSDSKQGLLGSFIILLLLLFFFFFATTRHYSELLLFRLSGSRKIICFHVTKRFSVARPTGNDIWQKSIIHLAETLMSNHQKRNEFPSPAARKEH